MKKIEDLRQEIRRESERLSAEHNPALDLTIEDCKDDMSILALNICRKNGIRTLRDLTLLHKTDWLKFRNSGKRSFECIDDLLTKHGLTWAKVMELLNTAKCMAEKSYPHLTNDYARVIKQVRERAECFTGSQNKPKTTKAYGR